MSREHILYKPTKYKGHEWGIYSIEQITSKTIKLYLTCYDDACYYSYNHVQVYVSISDIFEIEEYEYIQEFRDEYNNYDDGSYSEKTNFSFEQETIYPHRDTNTTAKGHKNIIYGFDIILVISKTLPKASDCITVKEKQSVELFIDMETLLRIPSVAKILKKHIKHDTCPFISIKELNNRLNNLSIAMEESLNSFYQKMDTYIHRCNSIKNSLSKLETKLEKINEEEKNE